MRHARLKRQAEDAIRELNSDTSVGTAQTIESLRELIELINAMLDCLERGQ